MKSSIAAATLFASVIFAQNPLIPTGISDGCSNYFVKLNSDNSLSGCTSSIISATGAFSPSINSTAASATPSATSVKSALTSLCTTSSSCSESAIRSTLADFYMSCTDELTKTANKDVITIYDTVYTLLPLRSALCTKDDNNDYCPISIGKVVPTLPADFATITKDISTLVPASGSDTQKVVAVRINPDAFVSHNLLFLQETSDLPKDKLCTTCTRNVLTSYIAFEAGTPYGPGLQASALLASQSALYQGVLKVCGENFFTAGSGVAAAAGLSGGILGGGDDNAAAHGAVLNTGAASLALSALAIVLSAAL